MSKKIALVIAHEGFQPTEYGEPRRILEEQGISVTTVSDKDGAAVSKFGDRVLVDMTLETCVPQDYDGIFIIGGPGALEHLDRPEVHQLVRAAKTSGKLWGAICISPRILAHAGLLAGHIATGWNEDGKLGEILAQAGARYVPQPCVIDGTLLTADGPAAAVEFGTAIFHNLR